MRVAARYGLSLHQGKTVHLPLYSNKTILFPDGSPLKKTEEVTYLGCAISSTLNHNREINRRLRACTAVWKRLGVFWKTSNCSRRTKLTIYNALINSKPLYALDSLQLTKAQENKLRTFQLKGLRQICKIKTTFVDRRNTNDFVFKIANNAMKERVPGKRKQRPARPIIPTTQTLRKRAQSYMGHLLREPNDAPTRMVTFKGSSDRINLPRKKRVGRPRLHWTHVNLQRCWDSFKLLPEQKFFGQSWDPKNRKHRKLIKKYAEWRLF